MVTPTVLTAVVPADFWVQVEPNHSGGGAPHSCYSERLKADLVPGTFVSIVALNVDSPDVVARIVKAVGGTSSPFLMEINIFKSRAEIAVGEQQEIVVESHLRHLREIVQTTELRVVEMSKVTNLAFVFTEATLQDSSNFFNTCQGMATAFLLRCRAGPREEELDSHKTNESNRTMGCRG